MEAKFRGKGPQLFGPVISDMKAMGKRSMEWDLNDWKWDGDLFTAAPLNTVPSDCRSRQLFPIGSNVVCGANVTDLSNSSSSCSDEMNVGSAREKRELEKRRRVVVVEDDEVNDEAGSLSLKLGGVVYPVPEGEVENWMEKSGKKIKIGGVSSNRAVCQVEDCRADLSNAKDYHRRHKVCDVHSKATRALVGNELQRFCQQCSRFHVLEEFDEGKRSCRRRLAGHNRRRRKTHPENTTNGVPADDERSSSYLLISLLRILSNMHSNSSDKTKDQDLLSHLLKNLASLAGTTSERNLCGLPNGSQEMQNVGASVGIREQDPSRPNGQCGAIPEPGLAHKRVFTDDAHGGILRTTPTHPSNIHFPPKDNTWVKANNCDTMMGRTKRSNIDLNSVYDDSDECMENLGSSDAPINLVTGSPGSWIHQQDSLKSSPPQTSGSGSASTQSPSTSSGEAQSRTDRIVFKLFGKDPSEFPLLLRSQILDWLAHSPTDIESYIRPGCIILTVYLRLEKSTWEKLCGDLSFSLRQLLESSNDPFWKTGWVYTRVRQRVAFIYDGKVVLDTPIPLKKDKNCKILSVKPIAVSVSERAQFVVKGFNIMLSSTRVLCALEGKYLFQQNCSELMGEVGSLADHEEVQSLSFPCSIPNVIGRGFIEVEDHSLSSSFFPFIVAEQDVCSEIRTLENAIEVAEAAAGTTGATTQNLEASNQALDFVHEMGWLLHRTQLKFRLGPMDPNLDLFPFKRFRCLIEFSVDHDWCAVVKKLLGILFSGNVDAGEHPSIELALLEIGLLHRAVRRNSKPMVEALLNYYPDNGVDKHGSEQSQTSDGNNLFRPDLVGPGGLTPLHIAASRDDSESILDALTDDPHMVGIEAWRNSRDSTGLTPYDYACQRGFHSYINMVHMKIQKKLGSGHVVVDIPSTLLDNNLKQKLTDGQKSTKVSAFQTEKNILQLAQRHCNLCQQKLGYGNYRTSLAFYRPAMLSMVAIAAVCVCVALLFKSSPEVLYVFQPFRWELVKYGSS